MGIKEIGKQIFDHQIDMTKHYDNKAYRVAFFNTFLASAVSIFFINFLTQNNFPEVTYSFKNHVSFSLRELVSIFYLIYIISLLIGILYLYQVIGPRIKLHKFKIKRKKGKKKETIELDDKTKTETTEEKSILFCNIIAQTKFDEWKGNFEEELNQLTGIDKLVTKNYIEESHIIACKIIGKLENTKRSKLFFFISFVSIMNIFLFSLLAESDVDFILKFIPLSFTCILSLLGLASQNFKKVRNFATILSGCVLVILLILLSILPLVTLS